MSIGQDDRKSTSAYVLMFGNGLVIWATRKQSVNALPTLESEYLTAANAVQEIKWVQRLIASIEQKEERTVIVHCDNQGTIKYSESSELHGKTKHIENKYYFVKDEIQSGRIIMRYVPTKNQLADLLK